jgi:hypothetical protein
MFRKIAIALVAASVLGAPVLAQQTTTGGESKLSPSTSAPTATVPETTEKSVTKVTRHRMVGRHHHHAKMAKYSKFQSTKMVKYGKYGKKYGKYTRHMSRAAMPSKRAYGAVSGKAISSTPATRSMRAKPSLH